MDNVAGIKEEVVDSEYYGLDGLTEDEQREEIKSFHRTKEKTMAAFFKARGFKFRGLEKIVLTNLQGRKKPITQFCFDGANATRRSILEYYNTDASDIHNVNAKLLIQELKNVNSLIANF